MLGAEPGEYVSTMDRSRTLKRRTVRSMVPGGHHSPLLPGITRQVRHHGGDALLGPKMT